MKRLPALLALLLSPALHAQEIGLQLYSLRHQMADDPAAAIAQVRDWGIDVVEGGGGLDEAGAADLKSLLDANGIALVSVGVSWEELRDDPMAAVARARIFGAELAMLSWIPHDASQGFTLADAQQAVTVLNRAGAVLAEHGVTLQYHPHGYELSPHGGGTLLDLLLREVTAAQFQMDVFWIKQGGGDPVTLLRKYPGKFISLHLKDRAPGTEDSPDGRADDDTNVVLGAGDVGINEVVAEARRQGIHWWFIEDESSRVLEQVPQSLAYLATLPDGAGGRPPEVTLGNFQFGPVNRWSFSHLREVLPTANIAHDGGRVLPLPRGGDFAEDFTVQLHGSERAIDAIAADQYIDGLLVIRNGEIVAERYYGHGDAARPHLMNSVSKSVVALLAGRLAADGVIDLSKPVSHYVPELAASGWGPDSLRAVLDMRDGSHYTEDYEDSTTSFRQQDCAIGWTDADGCPADGPRGGYAFFPTIGRDPDKAGHFSYRSGSTDVMGWVLEAATGKRLAELISEHIWQPMGAEFDAHITVDAAGFALADHGMSSTLRDLGRLGLLVLNRGQALGRQVVPEDFIDDLLSQPGDPDWPYGAIEGYEQYYRSYWWGTISAEGVRQVAGYGIHGQTVRVMPDAGMVVAVYSTWPRADGVRGKELWWPLDDLVDALIVRFR